LSWGTGVGRARGRSVRRALVCALATFIIHHSSFIILPAHAATRWRLEDWDHGTTAGWSESNNFAVLANPSSVLELAFPQLAQPSPDESIMLADANASDGAFAGDYLAQGITGVLFRFFARDRQPSRIRLYLQGGPAGDRWYRTLANTRTNEWVAYDVALDETQFSRERPGPPTRSDFVELLQQLEWIGLGVLRSGESEQEIYRLDDFILNGVALSLAGEISYYGAKTGVIRLALTTQPDGWSSAHAQTLPAPGTYYVTGFESVEYYWIKAYLDVDGDAQHDPDEPWGSYSSNAVPVAGNLTGFDFTILEPDTDNDGLPNEVETGTGTYAGPTDTGTDPANPDTDGDTLSDGDEVHVHGTNPNLWDSDNDGHSDAFELAQGTDPQDPDDYPLSSVVVLEPNAGTLALAGTDLEIAWHGDWALGTVDITLHSGQNQWLLVDDLNAGASNVTTSGFLPLALPHGTDYRVHVTDAAHSNDTAQSAPFEIRRRAVADFDADGVSDLAVYYPLAGMWYLLMSSDGFWAPQFGWSGPKPKPADYDGDGRADLCVYHELDGTWYIARSRDGFVTRQFGFAGTRAVPGDYDADGVADLALYHPPDGMWYMMMSTDGFRAQQFGWSAPEPKPADYDGDARADLSLYHAPDGMWYIARSRDGFVARQFGFLGTHAVPGDYDGDGVADLAVYDPPSGTWYIMMSTDGFWARQFGWDGPIPVPGDYDGDGRCDLALYNPPDGMWYMLKSSEGFATRQFGWSESMPVAGVDGE